MVNPFDRNFFKFFFGFLFILIVSFTILYFVGRYSVEDTSSKAVLIQE
ncbi:MAG: hypothetical protein WCW03_03075 [Candidatus Paceibacterota bacterium]